MKVSSNSNFSSIYKDDILYQIKLFSYTKCDNKTFANYSAANHHFSSAAAYIYAYTLCQNTHTF